MALEKELSQEQKEEQVEEEKKVEEKKLLELVLILRQFVKDVLLVYPEYDSKLDGDLRLLKEEENDEECNLRLYVYCMKIYPDYFIDILSKNDELFRKEGEKKFLPGIDFGEIWSMGVTENTESAIWKYLQLVLFCLIESQSDRNIFENTKNVFEDLDLDNVKKMMQESIADFHKNMDGLGGFTELWKGLKGEETNKTKEGGPNLDAITENLEKMFHGKIGTLAKEIAEETMKGCDGTGGLKEIFEDIQENKEEDPTKILESLMKNPGKIMGLVQNIGSKLDQKIKSGDIKESELLEEASAMMGCMNNMPGMGNFSEMFQQMGMTKKMAKKGMNKGAMQTNLQQRKSNARTKERLQKKLQEKIESATEDKEAKLLIENNKKKVEEIQKQLMDVKTKE